jgi:hypothetical protein
MKISAMNAVVRLQTTVTARVESNVEIADAKDGTIKDAKTYQTVPDQKRSFA